MKKVDTDVLDSFNLEADPYGAREQERPRCVIVMACDQAYAMPLATSIRSIVEANRSGRTLRIFVLTSEFSDQTKKKVADSLPVGSVSLEWVHVDLSGFADFSLLPYLSKMTYARLLLPQVLPNDISRVLYLDADVLVLDDVGALWDADMEQAVLAAVVDVCSEVNCERLILQADAFDSNQYTTPDGTAYFNAGVLLIDLVRWREQQISERALDYLRRHPQTPFSDQDALNVACAGRWKQLDRRWNCHYGEAVRSIALVKHHPAIIHFVGKWKPWKARSLSGNTTLYDAFRSRTQFARTSRDKVHDAFRRSWTRFKGMLKQHEIVSSVYSYFVRWRAAGPV